MPMIKSPISVKIALVLSVILVFVIFGESNLLIG